MATLVINQGSGGHLMKLLSGTTKMVWVNFNIMPLSVLSYLTSCWNICFVSYTKPGLELCVSINDDQLFTLKMRLSKYQQTNNIFLQHLHHLSLFARYLPNRKFDHNNISFIRQEKNL